MWPQRARYDAEECRWRIRSCQEDITAHLVSAVRYGHEMAGPIRDMIEGVEIYSINLDQVTGAGDFDDTAWIDRRARAAVLMLVTEPDPLKLWGRRKVVRKWHEQVACYQSEASFYARLDAGDRDGAGLVQQAYDRWIKRPDRKSYDRDGGQMPVFSEAIVTEWAALNSCA